MAGQTAGAKKQSLKDAMKAYEEKTETKLSEETEVLLNGLIPPIDKMDASTATLQKCEKLCISTNMIERLSNLNALKFLRVLSVGRNYLKSLSGVEACAETLEELYASYNQIEKPSKGAVNCKNLKTLTLSNNWIREWGEVAKLSELPSLENLVLLGNPLEERFINSGNTPADWQKEVAKKILHLRALDGYNILRTEEEH